MAQVRVLKKGSGARDLFASTIADLSPGLMDAWLTLADADLGLGGPFLHPAYAACVSEVRAGVEVGVMLEGGTPVGFVPFERTRLGVGRPIGGRLCDRSGAVGRPGVSWDMAAMTRAAGLRMLRLAHVPSGPAFAPYLGPRVVARFLDLSAGFESYRRAIVASGSTMFKRLSKRAGKLEEELGPLRFEWNDASPSAWESLSRWKGLQRRATRTPNVLDLPWARALLARLRNTDSAGFGGVFSCLYAGDTLCAAHFGLRSRHVLHYWITAYDEDLSKHSPGMLLLTRVAEAAAERGIARVDLGPGDEPYKARAGTGEDQVSDATVCANAAAGAVVGAADAVKAWSRHSLPGEWLRAACRRVTRGGYLVRSALGGGRRPPTR